MPRKPTIDRPARWGDGYVQQRASGRWQARWHDGNRWRAQTVASEDEAYDIIRRQSAAVRSGRYIEPELLTVAQAMHQWADRHSRSGVKPSTMVIYQNEIERHIIPALGRHLVTQLNASVIQHWIDRMSRGGSAPSSIRIRIQPLRAMLRDAVGIGIISVSPADYIRLPNQTSSRKPTWSANEAARVVAAARDRGPMWHVMYVLALTTAVRPGELRAISWRDIDLDAGRITIRRTMTRDVDRRQRVGSSTKTGRDRAILLSPAAISALTTWRQHQVLRHIDGYVFLGARGGVIDNSVISLTHRAIVTAAGVPYIRPHDMRHTAATLLLASGVHPKIVADLLGHSSITTTLNTYSHVDASMQQTAIDILANAIDPARNRA